MCVFGVFSYRDIGDTANVQRIEKGYSITPYKPENLCHGDNTMGESCIAK